MTNKRIAKAEEKLIRQLLEKWRDATRAGKKDEVLANHAPDAHIFDALPPLQHKSAAAYRKSFDDWWPENEGQGKFDLHELHITVGGDAAFAHALIHCGGSQPNGDSFEDWVRATICLRKVAGKWVITHQHISMPIAGSNPKPS